MVCKIAENGCVGKVDVCVKTVKNGVQNVENGEQKTRKEKKREECRNVCKSCFQLAEEGQATSSARVDTQNFFFTRIVDKNKQ